MVLILYGFVVFLATLLGSFVGLGGGVIIKPVLDVINAHSLTEISFFSSCAVFAMSITSTTRHIIKKTPIKPSIVLLVALGSVGGGLLGNYLFNYALSVSSTPNTVRGIQSAILAVFLVCVIIFVSGNFKTFNVIVYLFYPGYRHLISGISKHLMLLFIFSPSALSTGNTLFQNISCYCLSLAFPRFLVSPLPFFPLYFLYFSIFYQPTPLS